jgi:hypothetical protein
MRGLVGRGGMVDKENLLDAAQKNADGTGEAPSWVKENQALPASPPALEVSTTPGIGMANQSSAGGPRVLQAKWVKTKRRGSTSVSAPSQQEGAISGGAMPPLAEAATHSGEVLPGMNNDASTGAAAAAAAAAAGSGAGQQQNADEAFRVVSSDGFVVPISRDASAKSAVLRWLSEQGRKEVHLREEKCTSAALVAVFEYLEAMARTESGQLTLYDFGDLPPSPLWPSPLLLTFL